MNNGCINTWLLLMTQQQEQECWAVQQDNAIYGAFLYCQKQNTINLENFCF